MINVYDTKLVSFDMFDKIVHLPYSFTRVDVPPTEQTPEVDFAGLYWTHQFYNFHSWLMMFFNNMGIKSNFIHKL